MKTIAIQVLLVSLLLTPQAFAMGKKHQPFPQATQSYDLDSIYQTITTAAAKGELPGNCKLAEDAMNKPRIVKYGNDTFASFTIPLQNDYFYVEMRAPAEEYSDVTGTDGIRTVRTASYDVRDEIPPASASKQIVEMKFKGDTLVSFKAWELFTVFDPTTNDPEPKAGDYAAICE